MEIFFRTYAVTSGHYDRSAFYVHFGFFYVAFYHLYYIIGVWHVFFNVVAFHFSLVVRGNDFFFHHAFANSGHLRTVFGVDDSGDDISAERRAYLVKEVLVRFAFFLVFVVAYFQRSAVGGKSAGKRGGHAWTEVTAYHGGAHKAYLRFFLLEQVDHYRSVRQGSVGVKARSVEYVQYVHPERHHLFFNTVQF